MWNKYYIIILQCKCLALSADLSLDFLAGVPGIESEAKVLWAGEPGSKSYFIKTIFFQKLRELPAIFAAEC